MYDLIDMRCKVVMMTLGWMNFLMMVRVWLIEPNLDRLCFEVVEIDDEMRC